MRCNRNWDGCQSKEEIEQVFLLIRVIYKTVLELHIKRKVQKQSGQLPIFIRSIHADWLRLRRHQ